jgi:hypothetical protein
MVFIFVHDKINESINAHAKTIKTDVDTNNCKSNSNRACWEILWV